MFKLLLLAAVLAFAAAVPAPAPAPEPKPGALLAAPAYTAGYATGYIAPAAALPYNSYSLPTYAYGSYALPYYRAGYIL